MSAPEPTSAPSAEEAARHFAQRLQAEIAADADRRRREDPELARAEREIERAWAHVAPPGAVGPAEELLLDRIDRLSLVDVDAPIGSRAGIRQVKGAIRKGTYWYLRYVSDQLNALHNVQARVLRRMDERLARVEAAVGLDRAIDGLVAAPAAPSAAIGARLAVAATGLDGPVVVAACGAGDCVEALVATGVEAYGIDADADAVLVGIDNGIDLRVEDPRDHLLAVEPASLGGVVFGAAVARVTPATVLELVDAAVAACGPGGLIAVVAEDRDGRTVVERDLLAGRGVAAATWAHVLQAAGASVEVVEVDDEGVDALVIARLP